MEDPKNNEKDKKEFKADLKSIQNVEIFSAGVWNGDEYSIKDLDIMVKVFNETKETIRPFLKLGHNDDQKVLEEEGMPAAGWIDNLRRIGNKLVADFIDIPNKIYELIENKAFRRVSSEIFWNIDFDGKVYKRMLAGVALLGAETPGVGNLREILALYANKNYDLIKNYAKPGEEFLVKKYNTEDKEDMDKIKELEEKLAKFETLLKEMTDKNSTLEEEKKEFEAKAKKFETEKQEKETELAVKGLKLPKSAEEYATALLGEEKKEYTINKKNFNKAELLSEILKLYEASLVNENETELGEKKATKSSEFEAEIEEYQLKHKVDYATAYKAVMRGKDDSPKLMLTEEE